MNKKDILAQKYALKTILIKYPNDKNFNDIILEFSELRKNNFIDVSEVFKNKSDIFVTNYLIDLYVNFKEFIDEL